MPLTIGIIAVVAIAVGASVSQGMISNNVFEAIDLTKRGMDLPCIWVFLDTSILNSRQHYDFGARSSRALNLPFLNLCYESIARQNASQYRIRAISGLAELAELLGGWKELPEKLQNPLVTLEPADFAWIRASILAKHGGMW